MVKKGIIRFSCQVLIEGEIFYIRFFDDLSTYLYKCIRDECCLFLVCVHTTETLCSRMDVTYVNGFKGKMIQRFHPMFPIRGGPQPFSSLRCSKTSSVCEGGSKRLGLDPRRYFSKTTILISGMNQSKCN